MRRYGYSNLVKAKAILTVPDDIKIRGGWKSACYRDQEGASLRSAKVKHVEGGILFQDIGSSLQVLFPPHHGVVFIPSERLVNRRPASLGWYTELFLGKSWVELDVEGCLFSVVIQKQEGCLDQELQNV